MLFKGSRNYHTGKGGNIRMIWWRDWRTEYGREVVRVILGRKAEVEALQDG